MSSIVIKGDTSGQIEIAAPAVAGSTTLTLPTGSGNIIKDDGSGNLSVSGAITGTGGIYLGGTASANLLDDYEEGTWTPTLGGATTDPTCTYAFNQGYYVKVGSLVNIKGGLRCTANSGGSGQVVIRGLPFTVLGHLATTSVEGNGSAAYWGGLSTAKSWLGVWAFDSSTNLFWTSTSSTHTIVESLQNSDLGSAFECRFSISYMTAD